jgi:Ca-activated chloride channel family protein
MRYHSSNTGGVNMNMSRSWRIHILVVVSLTGLATLAALLAAGCASRSYHVSSGYPAPDSRAIGTSQKMAGYPVMLSPPGSPLTGQGEAATGLGEASADREEYAGIVENPFVDASRQAFSTFAVDVDTAAYTNVRRMINQGTLPPADAVRIEEFINYFQYDHTLPTGDEPYGLSTELAESPWSAGNLLMMVGLRTRPIGVENLPPANLVFLLDVSGSMNSPDKLPLVKQAFGLLTANLRARDTVAIVVYAGAAGLVLPATPGNQRSVILEALDALSAGGSTAGGAGIQLAYEVALQNFKPGGTNRIILASDGDFNVGPRSRSELEALIVSMRDKEIFLTIYGFGYGNYRDSTMELLANKGNGAYAYIDSLSEARRALVEDLGATLLTVAKDVKIQVEFNPDAVTAYRLIGYENRLLEEWEFLDDSRDAGEMGAGHAVTALYEIEPRSGFEAGTEQGSPQPVPQWPAIEKPQTWAMIRTRYKAPTDEQSLALDRELHTAPGAFMAASRDLRQAAVLAAWGMLLRNSPHRGTANSALVLDILGSLPTGQTDHRLTELAGLVHKAASLGAP